MTAVRVPTMKASTRNYAARRGVNTVAMHVVLLLMSLMAVLPLAGIVLVSFYPADQPVLGLQIPTGFSLENYQRAWQTAGFDHLLLHSAFVALVVVPITCALAVLTGYAFGTMRFPGQSVIFVVFILGLLMPFEATIIPLYYNLRDVGLDNTFLALMLPEIALFLSFGTFWMRAHFRSTPRALIEAGRIDGANSWTILTRILLPNARPAISTMAVLFFIWSWNEFLLALVLAQDPAIQTAPAGLGLFVGQHLTDTSGLAAAAVIVTVPSLVIYVLLQRHFIRGVTSGGVKG